MYIEPAGIFTALTAALLLTGCGSGSSAPTGSELVLASDSVPEPVKMVVRAVVDDDSTLFSNIVSYPLDRPYPLKPVADKKEMLSYYKTMVDDSLRREMRRARPERWSSFGWRGWSLDDGRYVWVDDSLYEMPYVSAAERRALDSLSREEISSLDPALGGNWRPSLCLVDREKGEVYRIDARGDEAPDTAGVRLAIYPRHADLRKRPRRVMHGHRHSEGTASTPIFIFKDKKGPDISIMPENPEGVNPVLIIGDTAEIELEKAYWRDLLKKR